jgi:hypothetical protein
MWRRLASKRNINTYANYAATESRIQALNRNGGRSERRKKARKMLAVILASRTPVYAKTGRVGGHRPEPRIIDEIYVLIVRCRRTRQLATGAFQKVRSSSAVKTQDDCQKT